MRNLKRQINYLCDLIDRVSQGILMTSKGLPVKRITEIFRSDVSRRL